MIIGRCLIESMILAVLRLGATTVRFPLQIHIPIQQRRLLQEV